MIPRVGPTLVAATLLATWTLGCQKTADEGAEQQPLSKTEAVKCRQVSIKVTGLT